MSAPLSAVDIQADFPKKIIPLCYFSYLPLCGESFCCVPGDCAGFIFWFWKGRSIAWAQPGGICHLTGSESSGDSKDWECPSPVKWFYCCQNHPRKLFQARTVRKHPVAQLGCEGTEELFQGGSCGFGNPCLHLAREGVPGTGTELHPMGFTCRCRGHAGGTLGWGS